jgi:hypothetical protein
VQSITQQGNTIRFNYLEPKVGRSADWGSPYLYWVPLGELQAGTYTLEVHDLDRKVTLLTRRVKVQAKAN